MYLKETKSALHVHCHITHHSQNIETTQVSTTGRLDKENTGNTYSGILFSHKEEILPFVATQMNLEGIMLQRSQGDKDIFW